MRKRRALKILQDDVVDVFDARGDVSVEVVFLTWQDRREHHLDARQRFPHFVKEVLYVP